MQTIQKPLMAAAILGWIAASHSAQAHMPDYCEPILESLTAQVDRVEEKLFMAMLDFNLYSKASTPSIAQQVISALGEYTMENGRLAKVYGTFMTCVGEGGAMFQELGDPEYAGADDWDLR